MTDARGGGGAAREPAVARLAAGLLDTSVFIASETSRPLGQLPRRVAVSAATIGELYLGVLNASDENRARRGETLAVARRADPYPLDEAVMCRWAELIRDCRSAGVHRVVKLTDSLIAATAVARGLPVVTQDDDFDAIASAHPALRVAKI